MKELYNIIKVAPMIECHRCHRLTDIVVIYADTGDFEPSCPLHFFFAPPPREGAVDPRLDIAYWERESIRRFIRFVCGNEVQVEHIEEIPLLLLYGEASEWELVEGEDFAWRATLIIGDEPHPCEVLFNAIEWEYALFIDGKEINLPDERRTDKLV